MDTIANQRYQSIKQQLDSLHYSQPFNIESSALVERLLTDLLKTTEAYQKSKTELSIIKSENQLNQQALIPLQKENERLSKENNVLHFDIIKAREELEQIDLKWKSAMRQITNECQDLRFLVDQKDIKIKKQDQDLTKMRGKYEKVMSKMYMSNQDEVIEGLTPNIQERGEMNTIMKGHNQDFQMSSTLHKYNNDDISDLVGGGMNDNLTQSPAAQRHQNNEYRTQATNGSGAFSIVPNQEQLLSNKKWAEELTKADDRAAHFQQQYLTENKKRREIEDTLEGLEKQIGIREDEIKRLHNLYNGGQNLEKLNVKFVHETNEKTIAKLQNQLDFVNKENHRLQQQLDFIRGGKTMVDEFEQLRTELKDLTFENDRLRKDLKQGASIIKDYQEKEVETRRSEKQQVEVEKSIQQDLHGKLREIQIEHDKLKQEYERVQSMKGAYNADKKIYIDRINELQNSLKEKDQEKQALEQKYGLLDQSSVQYRNEINFLNGKCSTLKRDLEYSERYLTKFKEENAKLSEENDYLKQKMDQGEREHNLLRKQVNGLQEDNDRINRMYQVVEKDAFINVGQKTARNEFQSIESNNHNNYVQLRSPKQNQKLSQQPTPKSQMDYNNKPQAVAQSKWKVVEDDFGSVNGSVLGSARGGVDENQITQKRY